MKNKFSLYVYKLAVPAILALCGVFTYLVRFTGFTGASNPERMLLLGPPLVITLVLLTLISRTALPNWLIKVPLQAAGRIFLAAALLSAVILALTFTPPPVPQNHVLEISVLEENNPYSIQKPVTVISISRVLMPNGKKISVDLSELDTSPEWREVAGSNLLWESGNPGFINFNAFMQAGLELVFKSGPGEGVARIIWDGKEQIIDFSNYEPPTHTINLEPVFNFPAADTIRKLVIIISFISEWLLLSFCLAFIAFVLRPVFSGRFILHHQALIFSGVFILLLLYLPVIVLMRPVHFEDPNLENVIRTILKNPDQPIFSHQLKTVAVIDATKQSIDSLEGIQYFKNLQELNLRQNNISDLTPLSSLRYLEKLDLRQNRISDLTPLSQNTNLVYLNLHSNRDISSIEPLDGLDRLETLILAGVQVEDEVNLLARFPNLIHLNLRSCGISDISALASLDRLIYLNLHSNPKITTLEALEGKIHLQTLILANVPVVEQVTMLKEFKELQHLNLRNTGINDVSSLSDLTNLTYLNLHSNPGIASIQPLARLNKLQTLNLSNVPVGDQIGILLNFPDLLQVNLQNSGIRDVTVLAQLMAEGALQDVQGQTMLASVDIHDNPLDLLPAESFDSIRPYWENISLRVPFRLPEDDFLNSPVFAYPAGFYAEEFSLEITTDQPHSVIRYTLDGSEPTGQSAIYSAPIPISSRQDEPNLISSIRVTATSQEPEGKVFKASVIRAKVFDEQNRASSPTATQTYFIDATSADRFSLPVISLATDNEYLFDYRSGIYVLGQIYDINHVPGERFPWTQDANYTQRGMEWERPVHIEFFDKQGKSGFSQDGTIRINGGGSRSFPQKSLRLYARDQDNPNESFTYELFPGNINTVNQEPIQQYSSFILRNSGNDWDKTMLRDVFMKNLVEGTSLNPGADRPVIVFINGEYWGLYQMQERLDENYLASEYLINPDQVVIMDDYQLYRGDPGDEEYHKSFMNFIKEHDLNDEKNYQTVQSLMDIDNFIEYLVSQIYFGNEDWPHRNVRSWRVKPGTDISSALTGHDGRWRWMLFDLDVGFSLDHIFRGYTINTVDLGEYPNATRSLYYALLKNENFKMQFLNTFADRLNTSFSERHVLSRIDELEDEIEPEMAEHIQRWRTMGDSVGTWEMNVDRLEDFARNRPFYARQQILDFFSLPGTAEITIITDPGKGHVRVNSIDLVAGTPGVDDPNSWTGVYFKTIPVQITAIPQPGYRFSGWEGLDDGQDQESISISLPDDLRLTANFSPLP